MKRISVYSSGVSMSASTWLGLGWVNPNPNPNPNPDPNHEREHQEEGEERPAQPHRPHGQQLQQQRGRRLQPSKGRLVIREVVVQQRGAQPASTLLSVSAAGARLVRVRVRG